MVREATDDCGKNVDGLMIPTARVTTSRYLAFSKRWKTLAALASNASVAVVLPIVLVKLLPLWGRREREISDAVVSVVVGLFCSCCDGGCGPHEKQSVW